jgi:hypothetical protein
MVLLLLRRYAISDRSGIILIVAIWLRLILLSERLRQRFQIEGRTTRINSPFSDV